MSDPISDMAARVGRLEQRFDWLDQNGTRAVNVVAMQVTTLGSDLGELKASVDTAVRQIQESRRIRWSTVLMFIGLMIPLYALVLAVLFSAHGGR